MNNEYARVISNLVEQTKDIELLELIILLLQKSL